jgi:TadE-like protein
MSSPVRGIALEARMTVLSSLVHRHGRPGQALVEFALILPILLIVVVAWIEFAFAFSTMNSLNFVARDLALIASEGGNQAGTDCSALVKLEAELGASSNPSGVQSVFIYWSDPNGNVLNGAVDQYNHTGTLSCSDLDGASHTLPYTAVAATYAPATRCSVLKGCPSPPAAVNHPVVDTVGVRITYRYSWKTPISAMLSFLGAPTFSATQQMRIEPVL